VRKGEEEARGKRRGHGKEGKMKVKKGRERCVEREMEKAIARGRGGLGRMERGTVMWGE
jgi:hypothetical protein